MKKLFLMAVHKDVVGRNITGVPSSVFLVTDDEGRVTVSHVPTGLKLSSFANYESASRQVRAWWKGLPSDVKKALGRMSFDDLLRLALGPCIDHKPNFTWE